MTGDCGYKKRRRKRRKNNIEAEAVSPESEVMLEWRRKYGTERGLERAKRNVMALAERQESVRPVNMATKQRMISL